MLLIFGGLPEVGKTAIATGLARVEGLIVDNGPGRLTGDVASEVLSLARWL